MLDLKALLSKILNVLKVDYIVEQGTSGDWIYRKWNSGIAECWAGYSIGTFAPTSSFGGTYYRILDKAFPTGLFNAAPKFAEVDTYWDTGNSWGSARALSKDTIQYSVFKNSNSSYSAQMRIYAIGTWKTFTGGGYLVSNLILSSLLRGWHYVRPQGVVEQNTIFSYSYTSGELELHNRCGEHLGKIWQLYNSEKWDISCKGWVQQFCGIWNRLFCYVVKLYLASDNYSRKRHGWVNRNSDLFLKRHLYIVDKMSNRVKEQCHIYYKIVNTIIPQRGWCVC